MEPVLVVKKLVEIVVFWRPGSHEWSWAEEYADIMKRPETVEIARRVAAEGFGFDDHIAPVLLGNDGRVWDGHHRICLAIAHRKRTLRVEIATKENHR